MEKDAGRYEAPAIDPAIDEALLDFMERGKRSAPDQWFYRLFAQCTRRRRPPSVMISVPDIKRVLKSIVNLPPF